MFKTLTKYAKWIWKNSRGQRLAISAFILLRVLNICLNLFFIFASKRLIDIATGVFAVPDQHHAIVVWACIMATIVVLRIAIAGFNTRLQATTYAKTNFLIRSRLFSALMQSQWQGREKHHSGDSLNRLMMDGDIVTKLITTELPACISTLFQLVASFIFLATMEWKLAVVILLMVPVFVLFGRIFTIRVRRYTKRIREKESEVQSHIQESLQNKTVIQSLEKGSMMEDQLDDIQQAEFSQILKRARLNVFARSTLGAAFNFGYLIAFLWGVTGIFRGTMTYGIMTAFLQLVGQIENPMAALSQLIPSFINATNSIDRLMELTSNPMEETGEKIILSGVAGIRMDKVSFRYPDSDRDVLKDFSWDFKPGSRTAIVGETGAGKSTMIRLMLSLLRPTAGEISIYDSERAVPASSLTRPNLAYVPQGNTLFSGTIRDNLLLGNSEATDEQMWAALDTAAADFVKDLPEGLDAPCGERGSGLSEGQAQRISIARGLLRPGSILLLDEFSSSLDPETEARLMENLSERDQDKTMIFITHREKIAEYCDNILRIG